MRKLLFLGGPVFQIPMIEKAKAMGLRVGIVDRDEEAAARPYADDFFRASLLDQEAVFSVVENYRPDGVTARCFVVSSDFPHERHVDDAGNGSRRLNAAHCRQSPLS